MADVLSSGFQVNLLQHQYPACLKKSFTEKIGAQLHLLVSSPDLSCMIQQAHLLVNRQLEPCIAAAATGKANSSCLLRLVGEQIKDMEGQLLGLEKGVMQVDAWGKSEQMIRDGYSPVQVRLIYLLLSPPPLPPSHNYFLSLTVLLALYAAAAARTLQRFRVVHCPKSFGSYPESHDKAMQLMQDAPGSDQIEFRCCCTRPGHHVSLACHEPEVDVVLGVKWRVIH